MINLKIKTNGTVRNLTLPYPGQSIPDIIEKDSVVTVSEVSEPEPLKYMEGHERNIDEITSSPSVWKASTREKNDSSMRSLPN